MSCDVLEVCVLFGLDFDVELELVFDGEEF